MDGVEQLDQAVNLALQGAGDLKNQALAFLAKVEASPENWIGSSLEIATTSTKPDSTQFFALQIIERVIGQTQDINILNAIRSKLWSRISGSSEASSLIPKHIKNKLAESLKALFVRLYEEDWPTFFVDLLELVSQDSTSFAAELYVQVLLAVHREIGDQLFARDSQELQKANKLKDLIRDRDSLRLAESWVKLLASDSSSIVSGVFQVMAGWVVWTDVNLVLPAFPMIEKHLGNKENRSAAALALMETISKKMSPELKLRLFQTTNTISSVSLCDRDSPEFVEILAKLVNVLLFESAHALLDLPTSDTSVVALGFQNILAEIFPLVTEFFGNEYDDTSVQLTTGLTEFLTYLRRESRRHNDKASSVIGGNLNEQQTQQLRLILDKLVVKSEYDPDDYELSGIDEEELAEVEFKEFRDKLRVLQEQLAQVDTRLFLEVVGTFVSQALASASNLSNQNNLNWTALELALYELSIYNDVSRQFITKGSKYGSGFSGLVQEVQQAQFMLFGQMVMAGSAGWTHPANQLWYMELVHRHAPAFLTGKSEEHKNLLSETLKFFVDRGVKSSYDVVRVRSWYLFYRLLKVVKKSPIFANSQVVSMVFSALAPHMSVQTAQPTTEDLSVAAQQDTMFTSQLYLYELCGIMFALGEDTANSADLMRQLLATMFNNIDRATTAANAAGLEYLQVHHNILALSSLTKGISDTAADLTPKNLDALASQLKTASQMIVAVLENLHNIQIVREACRQAFSRMLSFLELKIIREVTSFIDVSLQTSAPADFGDFLSFLGQLAHQFSTNAHIFEMFTSLCIPLFEKVFSILQQVAQTADVEAEGSTDAQIFRRDVIASYLQLVFNMLNNNFGAMLFIDNNAGVIRSVFTSMVHYSSNGDVKGGSGSAANQKMAVIVLTKMVSMWGETGRVVAPNFGTDIEVPLFIENSTYEKLNELCWTLPSQDSVNFNDAQSRLVITELGGLQKTLWETRGQTYQEYLLRYLNGAGLESGSVEELVSKLNSSPKDFKRFFVQFLRKVLSK